LTAAALGYHRQPLLARCDSEPGHVVEQPDLALMDYQPRDGLIEELGWQHRASIQRELKADHVILSVQMDHDVSMEALVAEPDLSDRLSRADLLERDECRIRYWAVDEPHAAGAYPRLGFCSDRYAKARRSQGEQSVWWLGRMDGAPCSCHRVRECGVLRRGVAVAGHYVLLCRISQVPTQLCNLPNDRSIAKNERPYCRGYLSPAHRP
jgi:hypothetical protein